MTAASVLAPRLIAKEPRIGQRSMARVSIKGAFTDDSGAWPKGDKKEQSAKPSTGSYGWVKYDVGPSGGQIAQKTKG